jgi:hypothetical protein
VSPLELEGDAVITPGKVFLPLPALCCPHVGNLYAL